MDDDSIKVVVPIDDNKQKIIDLFNTKVRGRKADAAAANVRHSGKEGHWLEVAMGLMPNASNSPDVLGYEMKNGTALKTTFGDWSADYYIFRAKRSGIDRDRFLQIFGKSNPEKQGRFSWSGEPCPKINTYNTFGQILFVDVHNNIAASYSYSKDLRAQKNSIVPTNLQKEQLVLAGWEERTMRARVENKFNVNGWFICEKDKNGTYVSIAFGDPITFDYWIESVKKGSVFFDSGMYQGNQRNYSQWRANNKFWDDLITSRY